MRLRIRCFLFTFVLVVAATPVYASLGAAPQCVPSFLNEPATAAEARSPLPELPRAVSRYDPEGRDYLIRTIAFEAGGETEVGKAAVAHVVLNRRKSGRWGDTIKDVVTRPWQFEPWMTRRKQMVALPKNDPRYQDAARIADAVLSGQMPDPTAGATHFLNPVIVRQRRGGSLPSWASGDGQPIGRHTFYAPNGGVPTIELTTVAMDSPKESPDCSSEEAGDPNVGLMTLADSRLEGEGS